MKQQFNFQVNSDVNKKDWECIKPFTQAFTDRVTAITFAKRLARIFRAEVRLTEGNDPFKTSGSYFKHNEY